MTLLLSTLLLPYDGHVSTALDVKGTNLGPLALQLKSASAAVSSEESKVVGEAWKVLDKAFVDKSFSGNDWVSWLAFCVRKSRDLRAWHRPLFFDD